MTSQFWSHAKPPLVLYILGELEWVLVVGAKHSKSNSTKSLASNARNVSEPTLMSQVGGGGGARPRVRIGQCVSAVG
jgi:hypothetical protein